MSQENVKTVVGLFENVNARDFTAVMDAYADDVVLELHGLVAAGDDGAVGKKAVGEWFGDWYRTFDRDYSHEIIETQDWGDRVLIVATHNGRGRTSGVPFRQRAAWIFTVRDGKVVRCEAFPDREQALEASGPRG